MSNWFADKVNHLVREVRETQTRSADDLAQELESQARRLLAVPTAVELASKWVERCDSGQGAYGLGREGDQGLVEPLTFHQALLRSQALEALLETCCKAPALRGELLKGRRPGAELDLVPTALSRALQCLVERLLVPGAVVLWPTLLEALLGEDFGPVKATSCRLWAKRALALVKRRWTYELIPGSLKALDRQLASALPAADALGALPREALSKDGIRLALARGRRRALEQDAQRLRARSELLCDACARLELTEEQSELNEAEQLLEAADAMLVSLDHGVKELSGEQDNLRDSLKELKAGLEKQLSEFQETLSSFSQKRQGLEEEHQTLTLRLEEVQMQLNELKEASGAYQRRSKELEHQLRETTKHFEEKIAGAFCQQKRLADEKLRAVACKAMAHTARDVVGDEQQRRGEQLRGQLRRRRRELRQSVAGYLRKARQLLEVVGSDEKVQREAQDLLQRALPLLKEKEHAAEEARPLEDLLKEPLPEDAESFFAQACRVCIDCGLEADWASVTCGAYLCVDCAGRHRGLGVHLSFVRSCSMDHWSPKQLRRMQLGGTSRLRSFLETYPKLLDVAGERLFTRYNSRAMSYYRQLLDLQCEGRAVALEAPSVQEGHLAAEQDVRDDSLERDEDEESALGSVEEELAAFESALSRLSSAAAKDADSISEKI